MISSELESVLNDTLQKIGRNIVNFQRMEAILKFIISRSNLQGTASTLKTTHEKSVEAVSRQTMGSLVKEFFPAVYSDHANSDNSAAEIDETWISFSFRHNADEAYIEERKASLARIVEERNILIHQMLSKLDQQSLQSCRELGIQLEEQAERVRPEYETLRSLARSLQAGRKEALETLSRQIDTEAKESHE